MDRTEGSTGTTISSSSASTTPSSPSSRTTAPSNTLSLFITTTLKGMLIKQRREKKEKKNEREIWLYYSFSFYRSLAHNTILVDGISQFEASGNALFFGTSLPDFLVMSANSTQLNTGKHPFPLSSSSLILLFLYLSSSFLVI